MRWFLKRILMNSSAEGVEMNSFMCLRLSQKVNRFDKWQVLPLCISLKWTRWRHGSLKKNIFPDKHIGWIQRDRMISYLLESSWFLRLRWWLIFWKWKCDEAVIDRLFDLAWVSGSDSSFINRLYILQTLNGWAEFRVHSALESLTPQRCC